MKIEVEELEEITLVRPNGRLDALTCTGFQQRLDGLFDAGARRFIIDMSQVPYVSSAGLRVFIQLAKRLMGSGKMVVSGLTGGTKQIFVMAGFDKIMTLCDDLESARTRV